MAIINALLTTAVFVLVLMAWCAIASIVIAAEPPTKVEAIRTEPISIEALANSRAVVISQMQQLEARFRELETVKKQLDTEIERRAGEEKKGK